MRADAASHHSAAMGYARLAGQIHGLVMTKQVMTPGSSLGDAEIIKRLAGDDERKAEVLRDIVGAEGFPEH